MEKIGVKRRGPRTSTCGRFGWKPDVALSPINDRFVPMGVVQARAGLAR
jgi:hypothetical protein